MKQQGYQRVTPMKPLSRAMFWVGAKSPFFGHQLSFADCSWNHSTTRCLSRRQKSIFWPANIIRVLFMNHSAAPCFKSVSKDHFGHQLLFADCSFFFFFVSCQRSLATVGVYLFADCSSNHSAAPCFTSAPKVHSVRGSVAYVQDCGSTQSQLTLSSREEFVQIRNGRAPLYRSFRQGSMPVMSGTLFLFYKIFFFILFFLFFCC